MKSSKILALDLDETLTRGGEDTIREDVRKALMRMRKKSWALILTTGRDRRYLLGRADIRGIFDAWVMEAGLSIYIPSKDTYFVDADENWRSFISSLRSLSFIQEKENTISFSSSYLGTLKQMIEESLLEIQMRDNKGVIILLPKGVNKWSGTLKALEIMGLESELIAAIGDSEIDLELIEQADFGAVVANADETLKRVADYVARGEDGDGVIEIIDVLLKKSYKL